MASLLFISHPEVFIDPAMPVTGWSLSPAGRDRALRFAGSDVLRDVTAIWSSREAKAIETAKILAQRLAVPVGLETALGENDRSATGFLPPDEFEEMADQFFGQPMVSAKGWERAIDAQNRIVKAVRSIVAKHDQGDLAICSHGAVGTLLYCALAKLAISRAYDQPGQGHFWTASLPDLQPVHGWKPIA